MAARHRKKPKYEKPKPLRPGGFRGKPPHVPTQETRAAVAAMAATFLPQDLMALQLQINVKTLRRHYQVEIDTAADRATATVVSRLHAHTIKHPVACFFWLQNRDSERWKHANQLKVQHGADSALGSFADLVIRSMQPPAPAAAPAVEPAKPKEKA